MPWLETKLAESGLGPARRFLGPMEDLENPSKAVLRVFFGQADACLVTSNAFAISCELNPQIARKLKALAASPPLVPTVMYFRNDCRSPQFDKVEAAILDLHKTTAGQQVLTIFQAVRLEKRPASCLQETRAVVLRYLQIEQGLAAENGGGQ
jgi:ABC-type phosphate/phosphonate transport system substrate-binding protein